MAKKGTVQKRYGAEFKISVIMDMREHHLGYRETVRKYWNTKQEQGLRRCGVRKNGQPQKSAKAS